MGQDPDSSPPCRAGASPTIRGRSWPTGGPRHPCVVVPQRPSQGACLPDGDLCSHLVPWWVRGISTLCPSQWAQTRTGPWRCGAPRSPPAYSTLQLRFPGGPWASGLRAQPAHTGRAATWRWAGMGRWGRSAPRRPCQGTWVGAAGDLPGSVSPDAGGPREHPGTP